MALTEDASQRKAAEWGERPGCSDISDSEKRQGFVADWRLRREEERKLLEFCDENDLAGRCSE